MREQVWIQKKKKLDLEAIVQVSDSTSVFCWVNKIESRPFDHKWEIVRLFKALKLKIFILRLTLVLILFFHEKLRIKINFNNVEDFAEKTLFKIVKAFFYFEPLPVETVW